MTAPSSVLPATAPVAPPRGAGRAAAADRGAPEAFGSALEDALAGSSGATQDEPATDPAADGTAEEVAAADAAAAPAVPLPPGLWALLAGVVTPPAPATTAAPTAAGDLAPPALTGPAAVTPAARDLAPAGPVLPVGPPAGQAAPSPTGAVPGPVPAGLPAADGTPVPPAVADALPAGALRPGAAPAADAPDADAPPATAGHPGPVAVGAGLPTGTADTADPGSGDGPGAGPAADALPAAPDEPAALPGPAVAGTASAATPTAGAAPAVRDTPVAAQLAPQLAVLQNAPDGSQTMTVVLTPDTLGEVTVQVTITDGRLDLTLQGASEHGRHALADALPELRRELEGAGLTLSRLTVDPDAPRDGGAGARSADAWLLDPRGSGGQPSGQPPTRPRAWSTAGAPHLEGTAPHPQPSASSGVDVRV